MVSEYRILKGLSNQAPQRNEWGARRMKISPNHTEPYAQFYIFSPYQSFVAVRGRRYKLADWQPTRCRILRKKNLRINTYPCHMVQTLQINLPYLTYLSAVYMCLSICFELQFGWSGSYINVIRIRFECHTYIHCGPCVDFY